MYGPRIRLGILLTLSASALLFFVAPAPSRETRPLQQVKHFVIIYQENHSFDNLYGGWERVNGLRNAPAARSRQVDQRGRAYRCLLQEDASLTSPPLSERCSGENAGGKSFASHFVNVPFELFRYIPPGAKTCGGGTATGGCTRDLVHDFYQARYQVNGGRMNRFVTGSNAGGLTMGHYLTARLPIFKYLHARGHPRYAIADRFFAGALGGSFLNHQWLIAARTPVWPDAVSDGGEHDLHSVVDANGMPATFPGYPLYDSPLRDRVENGELTASCPAPAGVVCGDFVINTTSPTYEPRKPSTPSWNVVPPQTAPTIGGRLSSAHVSWAWYSEGWSNAAGRVGEPGWTNGKEAPPGGTCPDHGTADDAKWPYCPDVGFSDHHQPFNYFAAFSPGTPAGRTARRQHLRDLVEFEQKLAASRAGSCRLPSVSFVKLMKSNEHPGNGNTGEYRGNAASVAVIRKIERAKACGPSTMIILTYDEFGGAWDHVPPPGLGGTRGPHDRWGPGVRIPAIVIWRRLRRPFVVDHVEHDTTSIAATIEHRYGLRPLSSRDAHAHDLSSVLSAR